MSTPLPPIARSISVSWPPAAAFERFTGDFGRWWPAATHSIGGKQVERVVFECRSGGLIFEQHAGGRRFAWGRVLEWDPPRLVKFTWHPSREPATAQEVLVCFHPEGSGTRVELVSTGWEHWGRDHCHQQVFQRLGPENASSPKPANELAGENINADQK